MQMHKISSDSYCGSPERRCLATLLSQSLLYIYIYKGIQPLLSFHLLSRFICSFKYRYILWRSKGPIPLQIAFHNYTVLQMEVIAAFLLQKKIKNRFHVELAVFCS